jgi:hypothetical protein
MADIHLEPDIEYVAELSADELAARGLADPDAEPWPDPADPDTWPQREPETEPELEAG